MTVGTNMSNSIKSAFQNKSHDLGNAFSNSDFANLAMFANYSRGLSLHVCTCVASEH